MFKKLSIILFSFCAMTVFASQEVASSPVSVLEGTRTTALPNDLLGQGFSWGLIGGSTVVRNAVAVLLAYCVAYTLYQTARGVGSTVLTWWKGEKLSPTMQRQVEITVAELMRKNGMGQMVIRRAHHEDGTCTCGDCCEARRVRK